MFQKDNLSIMFTWYEGQDFARLWMGSPGKKVMSYSKEEVRKTCGRKDT